MSDAQVRQAAWSYVLDEPVRILVADDDPILCEFASVHLSTPTATVVTVPHGLAALDLLRTTPCDLAVLDIEMPELDGFGVLATIRADAALGKLPVMMLTGHEDIASIDRAYTLGAKAFAPKPVNWRLLSYQIRYVLRACSLERAMTGNTALEPSAYTKLRRQCDAILREAQPFCGVGASTPEQARLARIAKLASAAPPGHLCSSRRSPTWMNEAMRRPGRSSARSWLRRLGRDDRGNTLVSFGIAFPMLASAVGVGLDYAAAAQARGKMQAVTDAAALYAAREFQMVQANVEKVSAVARNYASQIQGAAVDVAVDTTALTVRVTMDKDVQNLFGQLGWGNITHVKTSATAKMTNGLPLCLLALEPRARGAITLQKNARLTAPACVVNSNSTNPSGLISMDDAVLQAGLICSAGGKVRTRNTNYTPEPKTDCPVMPDPLAGRQAPSSATCNFTDKVVSAATEFLQPGVYCGGLTVTNGATVTLNPGTFIFRDGPLIVDGGASLTGNGVSIFMKGPNANLTFATASTIHLTAGKSGPLSGILIYDDPTGAAAPEVSGKHAKPDKSPREHSILSDDARMLLGTVYMPKGRLIIDATRPIADRSAYTVLVVQQLDLYEGPNLVLNTDYRASDVPIPEGVGPYGRKVLLTN